MQSGEASYGEPRFGRTKRPEGLKALGLNYSKFGFSTKTTGCNVLLLIASRVLNHSINNPPTLPLLEAACCKFRSDLLIAEFRKTVSQKRLQTLLTFSVGFFPRIYYRTNVRQPDNCSTIRFATFAMISDNDLYSLAIFLGCLAMLLIVLYHFLEVNAQEDDPPSSEKTASKTPPQSHGKALSRS